MFVERFSLIFIFLYLNRFEVQCCDESIVYPELNRPGPSYTVPSTNLSSHLKCYPSDQYKKRWILLIPGLTEQVEELFDWNWIPLFREFHWPFCTLDLPDYGLGDLQIAAEYVLFAIRSIYQKSKEEKEQNLRRKLKINILGHSLGGSLPRFVFRFWPDTRQMVRHFIAFGPTNQGTIFANISCSLIPCPIAITQQRLNSSFICAMNSYQKTFSSIEYTNILSKADELVRPIRSSLLNGTNVLNIFIQDYCPLRIFSEHLSIGIYDYCSYVLTLYRLHSKSLDNLTSKQCCEYLFMPSINRTRIEFLGRIFYSAEEHVRQLIQHFGQTKEEPTLSCSFRTDCITTNSSLNSFQSR